MRRLPGFACASCAVLAFATPLVGCYSYHPVAAPDARAGNRARVEIDPERASVIAASVGPRVRALEGTIVAQTDTSVTIATTTITRASGQEEDLIGGDPVVVPARIILRLGVRRFDGARTALGVAALAAGIVVAGSALGKGDQNIRGRTGGGQQGQ